MKKVIIYFGEELEKQPAVEKVLQAQSIPYRILQDTDITQTVGTLLDLPGYEAQKPTAPKHHSIDLMLFEEASDEEILALNEALAEQGVRMERKAMLTKHNRDWIFQDLLAEIEKEHTYFQIMADIKTLLMQSSELVIEAYTPASWKVYEEAFYTAYGCMNKECTLKEITAAYEQLKQAKQALIKR